MRVLVVDTEECGLDFVLRCAEAGHDVRWYRYSKSPIKHGVGFKGFKIVEDWRSSMAWAKDGLILTTGNWRYIAEFERWRDLGFKIFAPTLQSARLEIDRGAGMQAMRAAGIDLPPYQTFDSLEAAEAFARKSNRGWVFKPMGDETDKSLTFVAEDPAELAGWLDRQIKAGKKLRGKCMLQEKVEVLAEIGVSGWCGPDGFLPDKWQICFEHKKLLEGERGPATGEMGTVCQYLEEDKLAAEMLAPLEPIIRNLGHRGDFAVGAIVDKKGKAWPLEFTARCGWPAFWIQTASHRGDPAQWMRDLLDGKDSLRVSYDVSIGVVVAQPRFPYQASPPERVEGNPIGGVDLVPREQLHPIGVMQAKGPVWREGRIVDEPTWQTCAEYVLCATALGKTVERARDKVYRVVDQVRVPDKIWRRDIGEKVQDSLPKLHGFGYAVEMMP